MLQVRQSGVYLKTLAHARRVALLLLYILRKAALESAVEQLICQCGGQAFKLHQVNSMRKHIAWLAAAHRLARRTIMAFNKTAHCRLIASQLASGTESQENARELVRRRVAYQHFILDAA